MVKCGAQFYSLSTALTGHSSDRTHVCHNHVGWGAQKEEEDKLVFDFEHKAGDTADNEKLNLSMLITRHNGANVGQTKTWTDKIGQSRSVLGNRESLFRDHGGLHRIDYCVNNFCTDAKQVKVNGVRPVLSANYLVWDTALHFFAITNFACAHLLHLKKHYCNWPSQVASVCHAVHPHYLISTKLFLS